ncbi:MAG: HNH endonuclease [Proteobacteria bacterium]|nr:MAG: HNH endonuclease [Pseudomonadota bacterium]
MTRAGSCPTCEHPNQYSQAVCENCLEKLPWANFLSTQPKQRKKIAFPRPKLSKVSNPLPKIKGNAEIRKDERCARLEEISRGNLPIVETSVRLESGEVCHLNCVALYQTSYRGQVKVIPGRLIATNRQLRFLALGGFGWTLSYKSVQRVSQVSVFQRGAISLEISQQKGSGLYFVNDAPCAELIISTVLKLIDRNLIAHGQEPAQTRHIPQHIKTIVWQRDKGACVECGAMNYLEFDHIIPFSLGGASTEGNVQLLCRHCNNKKSNRI